MSIPTTIHKVDFCIDVGGMAGLCAAIAAARRGARVALMHDRPVFGGNASGECRVHICGADRFNSIKHMRETGILEELRLENLRRNPNRNYSVWDTILYEKVLAEPNIIPLLNCTCLRADMRGNTIRTVTGWQLTTQIYHEINARIFADCSGDAILAPLTGAACRVGREARAEYDESIAPVKADARTMGMTCMFQARAYGTPQPFTPPAWANRYDKCDQLPYGAEGHRWWRMGYWWVELGGEHDSIRDTEILRHELLKIAYGVWDHIKNRCPNRQAAENWDLEWMQFLPAKRESRRYIAQHVLTQNDIMAGGKFEDMVAYGGWTMDDHHPAGFNAVKIGAPATVFHAAPSPYGIPYRCLFSRNIANLMFAGRNAGATHAAMSSTRVMGTACGMGQAVGTAAALALADNLAPADMLERISELQQALLYDDAYLPGIAQLFPAVVTEARLTATRGDPEPARNGINRQVGECGNYWLCAAGDQIAYHFRTPTDIESVTLLLDSGLDQNITLSYEREAGLLTAPPDVMPKAFVIEGLTGGAWTPLVKAENNHQRLYRCPVGRNLAGIRFTLLATWGAQHSRVYAFFVN